VGLGLIQLQTAEMHLEDLLTPLNVRAIERDLPIETARAEQGLVQDVRPIGARQNHHSGCRREPIHLDQQLVQGVLALVWMRTFREHSSF
jgi:hypothetical protein